MRCVRLTTSAAHRQMIAATCCSTHHEMKVSMEGERVIDLLWDVIAARGFEKGHVFRASSEPHPRTAEARGHGSRQPGACVEVPPAIPRGCCRTRRAVRSVPARNDAADDDYLFAQGSASGLSKIPFHDPRPAFERFASLPNVATFIDQMMAMGALVATNPPSKERSKIRISRATLHPSCVRATRVCESAVPSTVQPANRGVGLHGSHRGARRPDLRGVR